MLRCAKTTPVLCRLWASKAESIVSVQRTFELTPLKLMQMFPFSAQADARRLRLQQPPYRLAVISPRVPIDVRVITAGFEEIRVASLPAPA